MLLCGWLIRRRLPGHRLPRGQLVYELVAAQELLDLAQILPEVFDFQPVAEIIHDGRASAVSAG